MYQPNSHTEAKPGLTLTNFPSMLCMAPEFDLLRFLEAQNVRHSRFARFENAVSELRSGRKKTSWTCFVFSSVPGWNNTKQEMQYAIRSYREAQAYYLHPVLGSRLKAATQAALDSDEKDPVQLFGGDGTDVARFKSCLTLFANVEAVLSTDRFFRKAALTFWSEFDERTLNIIGAFGDYRGPFKNFPCEKETNEQKKPTAGKPLMMGPVKHPVEVSQQKPTKKAEKWEIKYILASRVNGRGELRYQIDWKDGREDDRWYPAASIKYAAAQLAEYHDENPDQPGPPCRLDIWARICRRGRLPPSHPDDDQQAINRFCPVKRGRVPR